VWYWILGGKILGGNGQKNKRERKERKEKTRSGRGKVLLKMRGAYYRR